MSDFASTTMKDLKGYLKPEEVEKIINSTNNIRDRLILQLMYRCGRRVSEILVLRKGDILWDENKIIFTILKRKRPVKEMKPVDRETMELLKIYVFGNPNLDGLKKGIEDDILFPLTRQYIFKLMRKLGKISGIETVGIKKLHPHHLRHCLHPDTYIFTQNNCIKASEIFKNKIKTIVSIDLNKYTTKSSSISNISAHSVDFIKICAGGYEIVCSPNHRLFTITDEGLSEIKAKNIKIGTWIAGIKEVKMNGKELFGKDLARFLGYFIGDGCIGKTERVANIKGKKFKATSAFIQLCDKNKSILEFYSQIIERLWNKKPILKKLSDRNSYTLTLGSVKAVRFLEKYGFPKLSPKREVPKDFFQANEDEIREFIAGFYDAEGFSYRLSSSSKTLLIGIQLLLLRFGIDSHISSRKRVVKLPNGKTMEQTQNELYITDQKKFSQILSPFKYIKKPTIKHKIYPIRPIIKTVYKKHITAKNRWQGHLFKISMKYRIKSIKRYAYDIDPDENTTRKIIKIMRGINEEKYAQLIEKILESDIKWLKVKNIKSHGQGKSFDFTVKSENLITGGIISHNSFAVHQVRNNVKTAEDLRKLQMYMAHANISTTSHYLQFSPDELRSLVSVWDEKEDKKKG